MHLTRTDADGNTLTITTDARGDVHVEIENETVRPRTAHATAIDAELVVAFVHELLAGMQEAAGSDAIDDAVAALKPIAVTT